MCGRFTIFADDQELVRLFDIDLVEGEHGESFNVAPSDLVRSVRVNSEQKRELDLMSWGLVPFWAKDSFRPLINARSETVTEKPTFRTAASKRRCLIPTNGYYEWQKMPDGSKQPFFLSLATEHGEPAPPGSEPIMAMAGIFDWPSKDARAQAEESWQQKQSDGKSGEAPMPHVPATNAIITRAAADTLGHIHERMPLFVPRSRWNDWLDPGLTNPEAIRTLIGEIGTPPIAPRAVGRAVGNVRNNSPELILPLDPTL